MTYSITPGNPEQWDFVAKGLIDFNQKQLGVTLVEPEKVARVALDENGAVLGGALCTYTPILDTLYVEILWVDDRCRGSGIGGALLRSVEAYARARSCMLSHLETLDFQARDFYIKQGYTVFATLEGPPGHERYYMKKYL
ncbi:MAG: GNAT family N-acetyltransferase [Oscillospiraceae bacterium]|nr:GNAT family N-acetyltransferase [Oscillospiraceae bacterium]